MVTVAIMVTLIKGQVEEAAVGTGRISTLRTGRWGAALPMEPCRDHMCCDMAGFPKCQGKSGCAVSTASRANASLPLGKRKGCWSLGSPRAKRLQLPSLILLWVKADNCKNIPWPCCSLQGLSLKASIWLGSEEITDSQLQTWGEKWKATAKTAASFSLPDPSGGDQSKLLPLFSSLAQRTAPYMLLTLSRQELLRDLRWSWWKSKRNLKSEVSSNGFYAVLEWNEMFKSSLENEFILCWEEIPSQVSAFTAGQSPQGARALPNQAAGLFSSLSCKEDVPGFQSKGVTPLWWQCWGLFSPSLQLANEELSQQHVSWNSPGRVGGEHWQIPNLWLGRDGKWALRCSDGNVFRKSIGHLRYLQIKQEREV